MDERPGTPSPSGRPRLALYTKILVALLLGSVLALVVKATLVGPGRPLSQAELELFGERWIQPVGDLFIRAVILTVVPLVFASLSNGIYKLGDLGALGRMGGRTMLVFFGTAGLGALLATVLAELVHPGLGISPETRALLAARFSDTVGSNVGAAEATSAHFGGSIFQVLLGLVPENIVSAMTSNRDLLKVILFSVLFGTALTMVDPEKAAPLARVLEGLNEVMTKIISILMQLAPYGVFALVFMVVVRFGPEVLYALALYTLVVLAALVLHLLLVLLPLLRIMGGWRPIEFLRASREVWLTAFSTSSSSATLPTTMRVAEEELGVPRSVASFVLPLGATVNMDGTTIYQVVAVHFVAQVWGIELSLVDSLTLIVVAMAMGIGAAGVPGGVIPLLYVVLAAVGIPDEVIPQGIALILGMDRLLDMCRSSLNVLGDSVAAVIIARTEAPRGQAPETPKPRHTASKVPVETDTPG